LPGVPVEDVKHVKDRLMETASEAYIIQGQEIRCTASIGVAFMPDDGAELWHLLSVADGAMYDAKNLPDSEAANDRAAFEVDSATAK
jgi:GGDEF domain-containing protein